MKVALNWVILQIFWQQNLTYPWGINQKTLFFTYLEFNKTLDIFPWLVRVAYSLARRLSGPAQTLADRFRKHLWDVERNERVTSKPVPCQFHIANYFSKNKAICEFLSLSTRKAAKSFTSVLLIPTESKNAFHLTINGCLFLMVQCRQCTMFPPITSFQPPVYKPHIAHNSFTSFIISMRWPVHTLLTYLINPNLESPIDCNATVSLQTNPFIYL